MTSKKKTPRISETEWEIMRILWRKHPIPASEVFAQLAAKDSSWHPKTVKTLLARLIRKGALRFTMQGRSYLYQPRVGEDDCIAMASTSFLDRVFGIGSHRVHSTLFRQRRPIKAVALVSVGIVRKVRGSVFEGHS